MTERRLQLSGQGPLLLHASAVAFKGKAALILGASGSGKSSLALELMALGADLVADDQAELWQDEPRQGLSVRCPPAIFGLVEARGLGLLRANAAAEAKVTLVVDLDVSETERLPPYRQISLLGQSLPLVHRVDARHFPAALMQYLRSGRGA